MTELTRKILDGWDPDKIDVKMQEKREDTKILANWARNTNPPDVYRWNLLPEMDYLDK